MKRFFLCASATSCILVLIGCDRDRAWESREPGRTTVTGANARVVASSTAVQQIADARCSREVTCNNIGEDKRYSSTAACRERLRADTRDDLNPNDCPGGVVAKELDACIAAIKTEKCDNVTD